jgi:hypothetical protein
MDTQHCRDGDVPLARHQLTRNPSLFVTWKCALPPPRGIRGSRSPRTSRGPITVPLRVREYCRPRAAATSPANGRRRSRVIAVHVGKRFAGSNSPADRRSADRSFPLWPARPRRPKTRLREGPIAVLAGRRADRARRRGPRPKPGPYESLRGVAAPRGPSASRSWAPVQPFGAVRKAETLRHRSQAQQSRSRSPRSRDVAMDSADSSSKHQSQNSCSIYRPEGMPRSCAPHTRPHLFPNSILTVGPRGRSRVPGGPRDDKRPRHPRLRHRSGEMGGPAMLPGYQRRRLRPDPAAEVDDRPAPGQSGRYGAWRDTAWRLAVPSTFSSRPEPRA